MCAFTANKFTHSHTCGLEEDFGYFLCRLSFKEDVTWGKEGKTKKKNDMNEVLSSQVHEHIFGLNGPRRLLAENLDYQQLELTTEDREDHTFNGARFHQVYGFFFVPFLPAN